MSGEIRQKQRNRRRRAQWLRSLGAAAIAGAIYLSGALDPLERALSDVRFGVAQRDASGSVLIVEIDLESLNSLDVWPWPRGNHATVVDRLIMAGATQVALDIDLSSRSSPDMDKRLEAALSRAGGRVILPAFRQTVSGDGETVYTAPIPAFRRQVRVASVGTIPDRDGLIRRHAASDDWENGPVPSMPALLAEPVRPPLEVFHIDFGIRPASIPRLSYVDVLAGAFDPAVVAGRKVIVGATAVELGDHFATPLYMTLPGPVVQALAYESIIQERALYRGAPWLILAGSLIVALLLGRRFHVWSWRRGLAAVGVLSIAFMALAVAVQYWTALMLEVTPWVLAGLLLYASSLASRIDRRDLRLFVRGARLRRGNALVRGVVENSSDIILTVSQDMMIGLANTAAEKAFGVSRDSLSGRPVESLFPDIGHRPGSMDAYLHEAAGACEIDGVHADGSVVSLELTVDEIRVDGARHFVIVARDVSARQAHEKLLEYLALHDTLTGLPNRALLMDRLEHSISAARRQKQPLALMLLDLDRFKEINDTLGHAVGDRLLTEVGNALGKPLRDSDTIARLGGDEFAVLLPNVTGTEQALEVAERVSIALRRPFPIDGLTLEIGVSIGIAVYPEHGEDASQLMRSADVAMYIAKRDRSVLAFYDPEKDDNSVRNLAMGGELRNALDKDQLVLCYQPKIDVATHRLVGVEALVRWQHPVYGLVPPSEFISLAEQTGLIRQLSRWVLGKSVRQLVAWSRDGLDIGLAMNLSPRNLHEEDLAATVKRVLKENPVAPGRLTLEITENAIMLDPGRVLDALRQLGETGVRLAIDDFGTGYSSLAYLKNLPVDELKIDKSFIDNIIDDDKGAVIVRSTIDLAHNLGLNVVAEGVEGESQMHSLEAFGCDVAQGYHIARPLPLKEFSEWLYTHTHAVAGSDKLPAGRYLARGIELMTAEAS